MKTIVLISLPLFLITYFAHSQAGGNYLQKSKPAYDSEGNYQPKQTKKFDGDENAYILNDSTFQLSSKALMNVIADNYVAIFNIKQEGKELQSVNSNMNERLNGFMQSLQKAGFDTTQIHIDIISLLPIYEFEENKRLFSRTYNEMPTGFELQKNIHIPFKKEPLLAEIITLACKYEIYDFVKLDYFVKNTEVILDTLRNKSIDLINKKMREFTKLGLKLNPKYQVVAENFVTVYPVSRYTNYTAYKSFSGFNLNKSSGNVERAKKSSTSFYDKLPYDTYDLIINPVVIEPPVQFSYNLKLQYSLKKN